MGGECLIMAIAKRGETDNRIEVEGGVDLHHQEHLVVHHYVFTRTASWGDGVLLIFVLCFHSVFDGIAVGVADTKADAWRNLWTISLQKILEATALGIVLLTMTPKRPLLTTIAFSFTFAISSPIGVGIGIAKNATTQGQAADFIYAISMGIGCGAFIYVAINHLMAKGFQPQAPNYFDTPFYRFLAVLLGVAVIAVVLMWN